mmetsp:Transcript_17881/g.39455  ORF Transcript_17881/g.39455 Transcript_17881/m.39455 type:complete len:458 (+) Transcript_17881:129-1502(+)
MTIYGTVRDSEARRAWWTVIWIRAITSVTAVADGYEMGVLGAAVVSLRKDLGLSATEVSLVVTSFAVGTILGSGIFGQIADTIGRVWTILATSICLALACVIAGFTRSLIILIVARAMMGAAAGGGIVTISIYLAETSPKASRGVMGSMEEVFINLGIFVGSLWGKLLFDVTWHGFADWQLMFLLGLVLPIVSAVAIGLGLLPESPRYLLLVGRREDAEATLALLCPREEAQEALAAPRSAEAAMPWTEIINPTDPIHRRMLYAAYVVAFAFGASGVSALISYGPGLLALTMPAETAVSVFVGLAFAKLVATAVGSLWLVWAFSRRALLLGSVATMAVASIGLTHGYFVGSAWMQIVAFAIYLVAFGCGIGPVAYLFIPEVLESTIRSKGATFAFGVIRLMATAWLAVFPLIAAGLALMGLVAANVMSCVLIFFCTPETSGVVLEGVRDIFRKKGDV